MAPPQLTFAAAEGASIRIVSAGGSIAFGARYLADLPPDRYLKPAMPQVLAKQEKFEVLPGFEATRLPLPEEIMPTGFAWLGEQQRLLFTSLKGRVWLAERFGEMARLLSG